MRKIVDTNTGRIVVDTDLSLEYLFVGDRLWQRKQH